MPRVFYIQAIRSGRLNPSVVVDWIMVRSEELAAVKRQARMLAQTATDSAWICPRAEAIRIVDENGLERFRCWCRVALPIAERRPPVQKAIDVAFRKTA